MTADDIRRRARRELQEVVSVETADYLLDRPAGGWDSLATKDDLNRLRNEIDARFTQVDARFTQVDGRFTQVDGRFSQLEERLGYQLSSAIDRAFARQLMWLAGLLVGLAGVVVAAIRI